MIIWILQKRHDKQKGGANSLISIGALVIFIGIELLLGLTGKLAVINKRAATTKEFVWQTLYQFIATILLVLVATNGKWDLTAKIIWPAGIAIFVIAQVIYWRLFKHASHKK